MPKREKEDTLRSRPPLRRIRYIHRQLLMERSPNCSTLARELEVSTKTIQRDIRMMRDDMGFPLEWDAEANGYYYTSLDFSDIPFLKITEGEALALFVSQQALSQYRGTPFEKPLQTAFRHLAEQMTDVVTFSPLQLEQYVSFTHTGKAITDLEIYDGIMGALLEEKTITFRYRKLDSARPEQRTVEPWHMACINDQWYLFGWDRKRRAVRTFVLGRIRKILNYGSSFERPKDFSPARLLADSFGVFKGSGNYRVVLEFDPFGAQLVRERTWHESQKIEELPGDRLRLEMQLGALEELERWVLSFGSHVVVREPATLVKRIRNAAREMAGLGRDTPWIHDLREELDTDDLEDVLTALVARPSADHPGQLDLPLDRRAR